MGELDGMKDGAKIAERVSLTTGRCSRVQSRSFRFPCHSPDRLCSRLRSRMNAVSCAATGGMNRSGKNKLA